MTQPNFDRVARLYRWAEYLCLGRMLEKTRLHHLTAVRGCRHAVLLGDGDGRFTSALLRQNADLEAVAVDSSRAMLAEVRRNAGNLGGRLRTVHADGNTYEVGAGTDLVVTHFFLDCFEQIQVDALIARVACALPAGGLWLFSDFRVPDGVLRLPAMLYIQGLYLGFRLLTGLRVTRVPDHRKAMLAAGLEMMVVERFLAGLLTTEVWRKTS